MLLSSRRRALWLSGLGLALAIAVIGIAAASDHQDTPEVEFGHALVENVEVPADGPRLTST